MRLARPAARCDAVVKTARACHSLGAGGGGHPRNRIAFRWSKGEPQGDSGVRCPALPPGGRAGAAQHPETILPGIPEGGVAEGIGVRRLTSASLSKTPAWSGVRCTARDPPFPSSTLADRTRSRPDRASPGPDGSPSCSLPGSPLPGAAPSAERRRDGADGACVGGRGLCRGEGPVSGGGGSLVENGRTRPGVASRGKGAAPVQGRRDLPRAPGAALRPPIPAARNDHERPRRPPWRTRVATGRSGETRFDHRQRAGFRNPRPAPAGSDTDGRGRIRADRRRPGLPACA